jgi:lipopolysaccharide/colanic/teichoic acid biosynthesis glycosyltransferase
MIKNDISVILADKRRVPALPSFTLTSPLLSKMTYGRAKSVLDIVGGLFGCIFTLIIFGPIALLIKFDSPGPILFKQIRVGKNGRPFTLYKFRTMHLGTPVYMQNGRVDTSNYVTRLGRFMRLFCVDELPQFFNILKGDMSLVGPRPELPDIIASYTDWEKERLEVKPGITGWWQINGRMQPMKSFTCLDVDYVRHRSLSLDLFIIAMTLIRAVIWVVHNLKSSGTQEKTC